MMKVSEIALLINAEIVGNNEILIEGPSQIEHGKANTITFLGNPKYTSFIYTTEASAVIVQKDFVPDTTINPTLLKVDDVYLAIATLLESFDQFKEFISAISDNAQIHEGALLNENVSVGHFSIINDKAQIGKGTKISSQVFVGSNVSIGENCKIYPGVKIYNGVVIGNNVNIHANAVIGSDGFGFVRGDDGQYKKINQIGKVIIEDDVEIGANTVIDRGSMGDTIISRGVKLDNLIQIAHNVKIGNDTVIAAQTGIAGSTSVGSSCMIGGQVGIVGHINIADGTMIQAKSGISSNSQANEKLYGYPALPYNQYLRSYAYFKKLPEIVDELRQLKLEIQKLKSDE
jgi:UDP-3-O-[3-hydroxymyristoyl] glucosamine N-acyltransferase